MKIIYYKHRESSINSPFTFLQPLPNRRLKVSIRNNVDEEKIKNIIKKLYPTATIYYEEIV